MARTVVREAGCGQLGRIAAPAAFGVVARPLARGTLPKLGMHGENLPNLASLQTVQRREYFWPVLRILSDG